jgi:peptidoglycan/LPS O-acetylase OafA/YrhL
MTIETPSQPVRDYFENLQVLRAVAAILVMLTHILHEVNVTAIKVGEAAPSWAADHFPYGVGVHIFFVLSGFLMVYTSQNLYGQKGAWKTFLKKRFVRIVPLYWFYTSAMVMVLLLLPSAFDTAVFDWAHIVQSYLFIPHERPAGGIHPVLSLGWTLNLEMFFYVLFAVFLFLSRQYLTLVVSILLIGLACANILGLTHNMGSALSFWSSPIIIEFAIGMIFAHLYMLGYRLSFFMFPIGVLTCILIFFSVPMWPTVNDFINEFLPKLLIAVIIVGVLTLSKNVGKIRMPLILKELGDSSYTLYLAHPFFIGAVALIVMFLDLSVWIHLFLSFFTCVFGSYVAYRVIEKPMLKFFAGKNR